MPLARLVFDQNLSLENNGISCPELGLTYLIRPSEDDTHVKVLRQANHTSPLLIADFETVPRGKKGSDKVELPTPIGHALSGNVEFVDVKQILKRDSGWWSS